MTRGAGTQTLSVRSLQSLQACRTRFPGTAAGRACAGEGQKRERSLKMFQELLSLGFPKSGSEQRCVCSGVYVH